MRVVLIITKRRRSIQSKRHYFSSCACTTNTLTTHMMQHTSAYIKHKILLEDIINKDGNERAFRMVNLRRKEEEELFAVIMT